MTTITMASSSATLMRTINVYREIQLRVLDSLSQNTISRRAFLGSVQERLWNMRHLKTGRALLHADGLGRGGTGAREDAE